MHFCTEFCEEEDENIAALNALRNFSTRQN